MDKGLVFFTLAGVLLWLILDDFFGKGNVKKFASFLTPNLSITGAIKSAAGAVNKAEQKRAGWTDADMQKVKDIQEKIARGENVTTAEYQFLFDHTLQG